MKYPEVQVFYRYKTLLERHIDELAALIVEENGTIASDAGAELLKAAELSESPVPAGAR